MALVWLLGISGLLDRRDVVGVGSRNIIFVEVSGLAYLREIKESMKRRYSACGWIADDHRNGDAFESSRGRTTAAWPNGMGPSIGG